MYVKIENEHIIGFDVDDTLITMNEIPGVEPLFLENQAYWPIYETIEKLKQAHFRGHYVRVHSQGGKDWAEKVIKLLELTQYVNSIETKMQWCYDDLPVHEWLQRFDVRKYKT